MNAVLIFLLTTVLPFFNVIADECSARHVEYGIVCVCNATYCDTSPDLNLSDGTYQIYTTSKDKPGHNSELGDFSTTRDESSVILTIGQERYQTIVGFGGAFTDATGINIRSLPGAAQRKLLESYFGDNGNAYSLCRVPIGGTDFSPRPYSYDDVADDDSLEQFKLQNEDFENKIPFILEAKQLRNNSEFRLFASAWTAPPWTKTQPLWAGYSVLKDEYFQLWADYIVKFFDGYKENEIEFWGLTTGNEPMNGFTSNNFSKINAMGWVPASQAKWISQNLGPALQNSSHDVKIIIGDDSRLMIPYYGPALFNDEEALKYIDGFGVHWYRDGEVPINVLELAKTDKKDTFLLMTEACFFRGGVWIGSWERATGYIGSIIEYLQNGFVGWVDWNMALTLDGQPTYINYEADSPILVNASVAEFYKQPLFYALGHFSKFLVPGSVRVDVNLNVSEEAKVETVAFLRPDNLLAVILFNNGSTAVNVQIENNELYSNTIEVAENSLSTVLFSLADDKKNN